MPAYDPIVTDVTQSKYGYWVVIISVAPGLNLQLMHAKLGVPPLQAASELAALAGRVALPERYR